MSLVPHGPSPWKVVYGGNTGMLPVQDANGVVLAYVNMPRDTSPSEWRANASVIVNAPAMLALLEEILARSTRPDAYPLALPYEVDSLVRKAKGETP